MGKIGKYKLKIAVRMFKFLDEWLKDTDYSIDEIGNYHDAVIDIYNYVENSLALGNQDDIEFFIAAFYENYKACNGDWSKLGNEVSPITPEKQTWVIHQSYRKSSVVFESAKSETYMPSILRWDAYEGNLAWEKYDEDVRDTYDYEDDVYLDD